MADPVAPSAQPRSGIFFTTIWIYALWGFFYATLVQWLGIMVLFFAGTLTNRDDLSIFGKIIGIFGGLFYGLIFVPTALLAGLVALPFILLAAFAIAGWNRDNTREGYGVPLAIGVAFGAALYALNWYFKLTTFSDLPFFGLVDVAAVALASVLCWRKLRAKMPVAP